MKQKMLVQVVAGAFAGLLSVGAYAGQIQASSVSIAREVITTDTQTVTSPSIAYRFSGDVDARVQAQTFQVQFTVNSGEWAAAPAANTISVTDGVSAQIQDQSAAAPNGVNASYQVTSVNLSTDKKTVWATIVVNQGATALIKQPLISINVSSNTVAGTAATNVAAGRGTLTKLKTVVGDLVADYTADNTKCVDTKTLQVSFKHYVALTNPAAIATDSNATADEHTRSGATNLATLIAFPTNLKVNLAASTGGAILTPGGNLTFTASGAGTTFVDANTAMLGSVTLAQNGLGYDSNLTNQYVLAGVASGANANGLDAIATAAANVGDVEVNTVTVAVTADLGFSVGSTLFASTAANCSAAVAGSTTTAVVATTAPQTITVTVPNAAVNAAFGATGTGPIYICYDVTGANTIPSANFVAVGTINKAAAGANLNEQNNVCKGNYVGLGGGLKIDVRNYASSKETSGYQSVLRFINNSDSAAADVWGQIIHQDGKLGGWGKLADLPVRGVLNMTAAQIEAKLTNAATAAIGATSAAAQAATATSSDTAPRLRITSTTGRSLRVQNYLFNSATGQILEGSNQQGVDFEGTVTRAPSSEGMYQDQDANSGLNLAP